MTDLLNISGLRILDVRGYRPSNKNGKPYKKAYIPVEYIFFEDGETFIKLDEQDYSYHDCSTSARNISVIKDKEQYGRIWDVTETSTIDDIA